MRFENPFKKDASKTENKSSTGINRRDFLRYGSAAVLGGTLGKIIGEEVAEVIQGKTVEDYKRDFENFAKDCHNYASVTQGR